MSGTDPLDLVLTSLETQPPQPGEVLVQNEVIGLNPVDWKVLGSPSWKQGKIPGCDAAGRVVALGEGVTEGVARPARCLSHLSRSARQLCRVDPRGVSGVVAFACGAGFCDSRINTVLRTDRVAGDCQVACPAGVVADRWRWWCRWQLPCPDRCSQGVGGHGPVPSAPSCPPCSLWCIGSALGCHPGRQ